jgi:putative addiction module component (TIGR02574 family)
MGSTHFDDIMQGMSTEPNSILQQALALPESDRAAIAASLFQSLDTEIDDNADELWDAEIKRRVAEIDNGTVELIPWDDVMAKMRRLRNG